MVKLTFNTKRDEMVLIHKGKTVAFLDAKDFHSLIIEVKRMMVEASPAIKAKKDALDAKRKQKAARRQRINEWKIMIAVKVIDFSRKVSAFWNSLISPFKQ